VFVFRSPASAASDLARNTRNSRLAGAWPAPRAAPTRTPMGRRAVGAVRPSSPGSSHPPETPSPADRRRATPCVQAQSLELRPGIGERTSAPWSVAAIACARWTIAMCSITVSTVAPPRTAPGPPRRPRGDGLTDARDRCLRKPRAAGRTDVAEPRRHPPAASAPSSARAPYRVAAAAGRSTDMRERRGLHEDLGPVVA
jgi:hypothetical protein